MSCRSFDINTLFQAHSWTLRPNQWRNTGLFSWTWTDLVWGTWMDPQYEVPNGILFFFIYLLSLVRYSLFLNKYWLSKYMQWVVMDEVKVCRSIGGLYSRFLCIILVDWHSSYIYESICYNYYSENYTAVNTVFLSV